MVLHCKNFNLLHSRMFWAKLVEIGPLVLKKKMKMRGNSLRQQQRQRRRWQMTDTNSIRKAHWSFRIRWAKNFGWDTESYGGAPCKDHAFIYLFLKVLGMEQDLLFEISYHRCLKTPPPSIGPVFIQTFLHTFS